MQVVVAAFYQFAELPDYADKQNDLLHLCRSSDVFGTILLASEGINGTIAGSRESIDTVMAEIQSDERLNSLEYKESFADSIPFHRMKVRLKKEIVALGVPDINPAQNAGTYVDPTQWNKLIQDPSVIVVDTRNKYEVAIGTFEGAIDPKTESFRELPEWAEKNEALLKDKKVAMFCTGGIRCEKSTAYLKSIGIKDVYHLEGGILRYLEVMPETQSLWSGECFVFDNRVSVKHGLEPGTYKLCHGCREPLAVEDTKLDTFIPGVCCPKCHDQLTADQRKRFSERHKQIALAKSRGERHLGSRDTPISKHENTRSTDSL